MSDVGINRRTIYRDLTLASPLVYYVLLNRHAKAFGKFLNQNYVIFVLYLYLGIISTGHIHFESSF